MIALNISAPAEVKVNQEFRVEVVISEAQNLYNAPFTLEFDPAYLDFVRAAEGTFLKKDGKPTTFTAKANSEIGLIDVSLARVGAVGGVSGSGSLAVFTFKAKEKGSVNMGFGSADFASPDGNPMDADLYSRAVEVK